MEQNRVPLGIHIVDWLFIFGMACFAAAFCGFLLDIKDARMCIPGSLWSIAAGYLCGQWRMRNEIEYPDAVDEKTKSVILEEPNRP